MQKIDLSEDFKKVLLSLLVTEELNKTFKLQEEYLKGYRAGILELKKDMKRDIYK